MKKMEKFFSKEEGELINNIETYILLSNFSFDSFQFLKRDENFFMIDEERKWRYKGYRYIYKSKDQEFRVLWIEYIFDSDFKFECVRLAYRESKYIFPPAKFFYNLEEFRNFIIELL